jgi:murein DD-endopeptidase MepM/ murein hydrolase activator NlpD
MNTKIIKYLYSVLIICTSTPAVFAESGIVDLSSIERRDDISPLTQSVRNGVATVRGNRSPDELPELIFYRYKVTSTDTFWKVLSRTTLNVDAVMSVNNLSSPYGLKAGDILYLPSMRGVIHECAKGERIEDIEARYRIPRRYIFTANKISSLSKRFIFIPCGEITSLERSLFLGTGFAAPLERLRRTSGYGMRRDPFTGEKAFHTGIDLGCHVYTPVYAARTGKVIFTGYKGDYGLLVIIEHPCGYYSYYGHLSKIRVKLGMTVTANDVIALSGNTGRTTGPHLHFEIRKNARPVNPVILVR